MKFELATHKVGAVSVVELAGDADPRAAHELEQGLHAAMTQDTVALLLDLSEARWLSGLCLRIVVATNERLEAEGRPLALCGLNPKIDRALGIADMQRILPVFGDRAEALAWLQEMVRGMRTALLADRLLRPHQPRRHHRRPGPYSGQAAQRSAMAARLLQFGETEATD